MAISYLPNVSPKNNSTAQIRRRTNEIVSEVVQNSQDQASTGEAVQALANQPPQQGFGVISGAQIHASANAGGAAALPATPAGYTIISINGQSFKVPLYVP
jgi:hypothetical protein